MKTLFVVNGVVVGHGSTPITDGSVQIASAIAGATAYQVADNSPADIGWTATLDALGNPTFAPPAPPSKFTTTVTRPQLKMLFGAAAYIAIAASTDPEVQFFLSIVADPATVEIDMTNPAISGALGYLESINLLTAAQLAAIEQGWPL
jgi:hypothetical protein